MYRDEFNPDLPTKILIHGYNNNAGGMKSISDAFFVVGILIGPANISY